MMYLLILKIRMTQRSLSDGLVHSGQPWARAESKSQELYPSLLKGVLGSQTIGPSSAAFPRPLTEWQVEPVWDAGVGDSDGYLLHCDLQ